MTPDDTIDAVLARHRAVWVSTLRVHVVTALLAGIALGVIVGVCLMRGLL